MELMDIDEEDDKDDNQSSISSLSSVINFGKRKAIYQTQPFTTAAKHSLEIEKRKFSKAKRRIGSSLFLKHVICVVDTNVLLKDLNSLKLLITATHHLDHRYRLKVNIKKIIVPWIVIQELDNLKQKSVIRSDPMNAITFINEQFKQNGLVCGDREMEDNGNTDFEIQNNDDRILSCCLELMRESLNHCDKSLAQTTKSCSSIIDTVVLLSNDLNMQNKCLAHKISSFTIQQFIENYAFDSSQFKLIEQEDQSSSQPNTTQIDDDDDVKNFSKKKRFKISNAVEEFRSRVSKKPKISSLLNSMKNGLKKLTPNSCPFNSFSFASTNVKTNVVQSSNSSLNFKYLLEVELSKFIVKQYQTVYGTDDWQKILPPKKFNPNSSNLINSLNIVKQNWIGVFSDHFKRDKKVLNLIVDLLAIELRKKSTSKESVVDEKYQTLLNLIK